MEEQKNILVIDDDRIILKSLGEFLGQHGFVANCQSTLTAAISELRKQTYSLVITEINLPDGNGFELLDEIKENHPLTVVIVITGYGSIESAVKAIKLGANDYLTKPIIDDDLRLVVERAMKQQSLISENERLKLQLEKKFSLEKIISQDYKMAKIFELIEAVAETNTTILMTGASGTGKDMLARAIHHHSNRVGKPFVHVSCGSLPETLLESELFGHTKGSFTGAINDKDGKFLAADGGTIFLNEIATASAGLQVKLLRFLQERQFEPVGSNKTLTVDTRAILASNINLEEQVKLGNFREDLYYRINVINIHLPALKDRVGDISLLANHFLKTYSHQHNRYKLGINDDTIEYLEQYSWPGNIRELENVIERAVLLSKKSFISIADLPEPLIRLKLSAQKSYKPMNLKKALAEPEKNIIRHALEQNKWNRQQTAESLQINRTTLFKKMKQLGIHSL